jgi:hypothetical protein
LNPILQLLLDQKMIVPVEAKDGESYMPGRPVEDISMGSLVELQYDKVTDVQVEPNDEARRIFVEMMEEYRQNMLKTVSHFNMGELLKRQQNNEAESKKKPA